MSYSDSNRDNNNNTPSSPSQWTEQELRQRLTLLEQVLQERNVTIENLQRELRVANSKARITDEVQSENKLLRARLSEIIILQQKQQQKSSTTSDEGATSSSSSVSSSSNNNNNNNTNGEKKEESLLDKLRKQLNETGAPSPLSQTYTHEGETHNLPKTEEDEIDEVMEQARDEIAVESKEEQLLRERLEKLTGGKK